MTRKRARGLGGWLILVSLLTVGTFAQQHKLDDPVPPGSVFRIVDLLPLVVDLVSRTDDLVSRTEVAPSGSDETVRNRLASGPHSSMSGDFLYLPANSDAVLTLTIRVANAQGQPLVGKRVHVSRVSDTSAGTIAQPTAPTDALGITTARVTPAGPPHTAQFVARVVEDNVEIGQTVELVVQPSEPPSFFAPAFAPYYDGVKFVVDPLPLRVGQPTTVTLPLTNRRSVPVELRARIFATVPNIGLGQWPEIGETETMVLKPGETREVTATWVPTVDQGHVCLKVEVWGRELTRPATAGLVTASTRLVYASFMHTLSAAAADDEPTFLGGRQQNIGPVVALAPCDDALLGKYVLPRRDHESDAAYYTRVGPAYRAQAEALRLRLEQSRAQLDQQGRALNKELTVYKYLAQCSADTANTIELQMGRRPRSLPEKAFCADSATMLRDIIFWTETEFFACRSAMQYGTGCSFATLADLWNSLREMKDELKVMDKCAKDPPDPKYRTLAAATADTAAASIDALTVSMERYQAAEAAGDGDWMARHFTARRLYLQRYAAQARARADAWELTVERHPPETAEQLARLRDALSLAIKTSAGPAAFPPEASKALAAAGMSPADITEMQEHLRSAASSSRAIVGSRAVLLNAAGRYRDSADNAEQFASFGASVGEPGKSAPPRLFGYLVGNPRGGDETIDLFIRRSYMPRDWKVSIVDASLKTGQAPQRRIEEIEAGVHYRVRLHGNEQIPVSSVLVTVGVIPENTKAGWAVEGSIAGTMIGGIVHQLYVPGSWPDFQLPPIAASSSVPAEAQLALQAQLTLPATKPTSRSLSWMIAGSSIVLAAIVVLVWRRRRRA